MARPRSRSLAQLLDGCDRGRHPSWARHTRRALTRMSRLGIRTPARLRSRLESLPARDRLEAVYLLGRLGYERFVPPLIEIGREDRSDKVRMAAIEALYEIGSRRAAEGLLSILVDRGNSRELRYHACYHMVWSDASQIVDAIIDLATDLDEHPSIRGQALEGLHTNLPDELDLRKNPTRRAAQVVLDCLDDPEGVVRFWAMYAAGCMRLKRALPKLEQLAATDDFDGAMPWSNREEARDVAYLIRTDEWPEPDAMKRKAQSPCPG
ncbi:MAG: HEAT repeat domain-containing protein [Deltaproteobacteria bacterium]|nr:HEAT repeat domain-containing protein [Deltaproteobacteria bacterium]